MIKKIILFYSLLSFVCSFSVIAQRVGVVLSGGGAKGLTHIGVLKALEENEIPVDYIIGTSMGGVVGGLYSAGHSPVQIEQMVTSKEFMEWIDGKINPNYDFFFTKEDINSSFIAISLGIDSALRPSLRSGLASDFSLNFGLAENLSQAAAKSGYNFDKLLIPFRCVAAEIFTQEEVVLKKGRLNEAVRTTLSVPLFYRPIRIDGRYLFDGGLYNNFPTDVMQKEFSPDIIIGVNVSSKVYSKYPYGKDDALLGSSLVFYLLDKSDSSSVGNNGIYLYPNLQGYTPLDFDNAKEFVKIGYDYTIAHIEEIKARIKRRVSCETLNQRRNDFLLDIPPLKFNDIQVVGLKPKQDVYIKKMFGNKKNWDLYDIKRGYYRLVSENYFKSVFPTILFDKKTTYYQLELQIKPDPTLKVSFGGNISSRNTSEIFIGLQYSYFRKKLIKLSGDFYTGRFYQAAQFKARINFPSRIPFYLEPEATFNVWNFTNIKDLIYDRDGSSSIVLDQIDRKLGANFGIATGSKSKMVLSGAYFINNDSFINTNTFFSSDIFDQSNTYGEVFSIRYIRNSLNRKLYPSEGISWLITGSYINGLEKFNPGNTSILKNEIERKYNWLKFKLTHENYFKRSWYRWGYFIDVVVSNPILFSNFRSTQFKSPAFEPLNDSKMLVLTNYRAFNYAAFGIKNIFNLPKNIELRLEGYIFKPYHILIESSPQVADYKVDYEKLFLVGSAIAVYHSPIGPVGLSLNYYDDVKRWGVFFHLGYILFNQRSLE